MKVLEFFANLSTVAQVFLAFFCLLMVACVLFFLYKITGRDKTAKKIGEYLIQKFVDNEFSLENEEDEDDKEETNECSETEEGKKKV